MRKSAISTRDALNRHRWAVGLLDARPNPGEANVRLYEAALACLREAGFSTEMAGRAQSIQDAYIYGFALQDATRHEEEFLFGLELILDGLEKRLEAGHPGE